ncbi:MAG: Anaphase-promoting complex, cyclosome, subunit 3 [Bacteroidetes bacterium]|jgi:tetratricopeptide (TPR) repeat protein|nr:Anaphase-promoting complex, cyclosome, subunit 3 [Bacteroidota bacterium]
MSIDPEIQLWRDKTNKLIATFERHIQNGKLNHENIVAFVKQVMGAVIRRERFHNPYHDTEFEQCFDSFYQYIQRSSSHQTALVMIPMQAQLMETGGLSMKELIEYLHETILLEKGLFEEKETSPEDEDDYATDTFNSVLDRVEESAENNDYQNAIFFLDEAFVIAENNPLLIYDRLNMINNRAFYNCQLGNYEEGLKDCTKAISEDADYGVIYHTQAEIYFALKHYRKALDSINLAIEREDTADKHEFKKNILSKL